MRAIITESAGNGIKEPSYVGDIYFLLVGTLDVIKHLRFC